MTDHVLWLDSLRMTDLAQVGGKNASLGEMIGNLAQLGVSVPGGFATTADAYKTYLEKSGLAERIRQRLETLDVEDVDALVAAGGEIREWITETALPDDLEQDIRTAYAKGVIRGVLHSVDAPRVLDVGAGGGLFSASLATEPARRRAAPHLPVRGNVGGENGAARRHRLQQRQPEPLVERRADHQVRAPVERREHGLARVPHEVDAVRLPGIDPAI